MIKRLMICIYLLGLGVAFWPLWGLAAPRRQDDGTIPPPSPTAHPVSLTMEAIFTVPQDVGMDAPFELVVSIRNGTPFIITDLVVTYRDVADDKALLAVVGNKSDTVPAPGSYLAITFSKVLRYLADSPGRRAIEILFAYNYIIDGQITARTQTESVTFRVVEPTPTPTIAWTPISTFTPVPTWTPIPTFTPVPTWTPISTFTPMSTLAPTPVPTITEVVSIGFPEGNEGTTGTGAPPGDSLGEAGMGTGSAVTERPALVAEFANVPLFVHPGDTFTMTLVVRNISNVVAESVVAQWALYENTIVLIGTGDSWFLGDIRPGDKYAVSGQFYVKDESPSGIVPVEVAINYRDFSRQLDGIVNILVQASTSPVNVPLATLAAVPPPTPVESLWVRFLRLLFGDMMP